MVYLPHWPIPSTFGKKEIDYETVFERMSIVLEKLGNPHKKLAPVIHIAGTNGKGSVTAFLASILQNANLRTHIFTSPHLHDINERIIIANEKISDNYLYEIMEEVRIASSGIDLTFFEAFFIGTLLAFSKNKADVVLIEAGMGARIDATNIIETKLATIITPISFDHTEYLGNTIEKIAFEKAHIVRTNTVLIMGPQPTKAQEMIEIIAKDQNAKMIRYNQEFEIILDEENGNFDLRFFEENFLDLQRPNLEGEHQYINASIAIACLLSLRDVFKIDIDDINNGLKKVYWPSRLQKIENGLQAVLAKAGIQNEIYIDGAHNQGGAYAVAKWLNKKNADEIKNIVIVGFTKNKCKKEFLINFKNVADEIIAVRVDGEPNPENPEIIKTIGNEIGLEIISKDDLLEAIHYLAKKYNTTKLKIVICGSLHLARDVKKFGAI